MKIGIGVTTYNRPSHIKLWEEQVWKHTLTQGYPSNGGGTLGVGRNHERIYIYIADDSKERKGIAFRKNECLQHLQHCDYIFLFDDDCFPIKDCWADYFIEAHKASGQHHFLYLKQTGTIRLTEQYEVSSGIDISKYKFEFPFIINSFNNCGGAFMFLTKEVIEKVGGYNKNYYRYGYEHAGYSDRIHQAGLTPMGKYLCPEGASDFIYAMDYDFHLPFNTQVKHQSSLMNEMGSVKNYLEQNRKVYEGDIKIVHQPL